MWNNCFVWAHWRERQLWRQWEQLGCPADRVPCILRRPSRLAPHWVGHWLVGWWHPEQGQVVEIEAYTPNDTRPVSAWRLWKVAVFRGHVKRGDAKE